MAHMFIQLDKANYVRAMALLEGADRATLNLEPAWNSVAVQLRARELVQLAKAAKKAGNSKAPSHKKYLLRKARGQALNGRGDRAAPGAGPLTVTGHAREALIKPQTLEIRPTEMYMGVRVRDTNGKFAGDVAHIVPLQKRYSVSKRLNPTERNEVSHLIVAHIERSMGIK